MRFSVIVTVDNNPVAGFNDEATAGLFVDALECELGINPDLIKVQNYSEEIESNGS